jgi:hypothetical protein
MQYDGERHTHWRKENQLTRPRTSNAIETLIPFGVAAVYSVIVGEQVVSAIALPFLCPALDGAVHPLLAREI